LHTLQLIIYFFTKVKKPIITSTEALVLYSEFIQKEEQVYREKKEKKSRYNTPPAKFDPNTYDVKD